MSLSMTASSPSLAKEFRLFYAEGVSKSFGGLKAVDGFSVEIGQREIIGLIGPNGAGKTTVFNLISGVERADSGRMRYMRHFIEGLPAHKVSALGIARTFQNIRLMNHLSALENVKAAFHSSRGYNLAEAMLRLPRFRSWEREIDGKAHEFLTLFGLSSMAELPAGSLPYGMRRRLEMARALATEPGLLLLDEPAAGLNPSETSELMDLIRRIRDEFQIAVFLIEHDMKLVMGLCDRIVALNFGKVVAEGSPAEIKANPDVIEAYLGVEREAPPELSGGL